MEGIVTKALSSYFKKFIKDFRKEQFNLSLLKGTAQLSNLDLNESFIQELLIIPTTLEVVSAKCNQLFVNVPNLRKINKTPVTMTIDKLDLSLEEPLVVKPMPISDIEIKNGKRKIPHQIIRDMKIIVGRAIIQIKLLPKKGESFAPELTLEISNIIMQSTDRQFKVTDLSEARTKINHLEKSYKHLYCHSISLDLVTPTENNNISIIPIVKNVPLEVKVSLVLDTNTNQYIYASFDASIDKINFEFDEVMWQLLVKNVFSLKNALNREIPPTTQHYTVVNSSFLRKNHSQMINQIPIVEEIETAYRLKVGKWELKFLKHNNREEGFLFFGNDYTFYISPKAKVKPVVGNDPKQQKVQKKTSQTSDTKLEETVNLPADEDAVDLFESTLKIRLNSFTFTTLQPRKNSAYPNIIQQIISNPDAKNLPMKIHSAPPSVTNTPKSSSKNSPKPSKNNKNNNNNNANNNASTSNNDCTKNENECFIFIHVNHKWKSLAQPHSTFIDISVQGLQLILDRHSWSDLYNFLIADIQYIPPEEVKGLEITEEEETKQVMQIINKLKTVNISDYFKWYGKSEAKIHIKNTEFIFPKDSNSPHPLVKSNSNFNNDNAKASEIKLDKSLRFSAKNITIENKPKDWIFVPHLYSALSTLPSSQYLPLCRVGTGHKFQIELSGMEIETYDPFIPNSKVDILQPTVFQVYGRFSTDEHTGSRLELAFHAGSWIFSISDDQQHYLSNLITAYHYTYNKLRNKGSSPQINIKKDEESFIDFDKHAKVALTTATQLINESHLDYQKSLTLFESLLKSFKCAISFHAEKGTVTFPIVFDTKDSPVNSFNSDDIEITTKSNIMLNFDHLNIIVENSSTAQIVSMTVKAIRAEGFNHPLSPASLSLVPLLNEIQTYDNIRLYCRRVKPSNLPPSTEITVAVHGLQIISRIKKGSVKSISHSLSLLIPQLKLLASKISGYFFNVQETPPPSPSPSDAKALELGSSNNNLSTEIVVADNNKSQSNVENESGEHNTKIDETIETIAHTISDRAHFLEETLEGLQIAWEIIVSDCSLQVFDSHWDEELKNFCDLSNKPFGAIFITSNVTKSYPAQTEYLSSEITRTQERIVQSQKAKDKDDVEIKELALLLADWKLKVKTELERLTKEVKYLENELTNSQSSLSKLENENTQLKSTLQPSSTPIRSDS